MQLAQRFCCFDLETGVMIWGWIGTGLSVFGLVLNIFLLATYTRDIETNIVIAKEVGVFDKYYESGIIEAQTGYCILIAMCVLGLGTSYMVVLAVKRRNRQYLLPWLIGNCLSLLVWACLLLPVLLPAMLIISPLALIGYVWYCVYSMYQVLQTEGQAKLEPPKTALDAPQEFYN